MVSNLQFSETFPQKGMDFRRVAMKFLFHKKLCEAGWAMSLLEGFIYPGRSTNILFHMEWFIWVSQWRFQGPAPPPLIFRPYWCPKGRKRFFWHCPRRPFISGSGWPGLPLIWRSGSATVFSLELEISRFVDTWRQAVSATSSVHIWNILTNDDDRGKDENFQLKARWIIPLPGGGGALMEKDTGMAVGI